MRYVGSVLWYINITITILEIIHRPVFYLKQMMDNVRTLQETQGTSGVARIPTSFLTRHESRLKDENECCQNYWVYGLCPSSEIVKYYEIQLRRMASSGMLRRVAVIGTDLSEEHKSHMA
jgi:hypothetical protein